MQVGELAARTGASIRAIRHYDQSGLLQATRGANGYRQFQESAIERVHAIRDLLDSGFTVEDVRMLSSCLQDVSANDGCCNQTVAVYREKLARVDAQVRALQQLRLRIEARIAQLEPC